MKKLISAGLASILAISALSAAAYADEQTIVASGVVAKPAIKVTLPKSMAFVFNPYGLTVDIKGKVSTEVDNGKTGNDRAVLNNTIIVPSYQFEATTKDIGWLVTNNAGAGANIKMAVYAYAKNETTATMEVYDATNTTWSTASTGVKDSTTKKSVGLTITAAAQLANGTYDTAKKVKVHTGPLASGSVLDYSNTDDTKLVVDGTAASSAATGQPATLIDTILGEVTVDGKAQPGTAAITMAGAIGNKGGLQWEDTDIPTVNFVFAFDYAGGTTALS